MSQSTLDPKENFQSDRDNNYIIVSSDDESTYTSTDSEGENENERRCPGCYPRFQPGQRSHMVPGGCLYLLELDPLYNPLYWQRSQISKDPKD